MHIVIATVYQAVGGSSRVLLAATDALRAEQQVTLRAPLPQADSRTDVHLPERVLDTWTRKCAALPRLFRILCREFRLISQSPADAIYVHDEPSLYIYGAIAKILRRRVVWHVHMNEGRGLRRAIRNALCDAKLFVSPSLAVGPQRKPSAIISNPIAVTAPLRAENNDAFLRIAMIGSVSRLKNQMLGIRTLQEVRRRGVGARLTIYGNVLEPDYRDDLARLIAELRLDDAVVIRGFVPLEQALSENNVVVACSRLESFGLAVAEALAAGLPVVATDIPAHREFLLGRDTQAFALCAPEPSVMATALQRVRADAAFAAVVRQAFSAEHFTAALRIFFRELAGRWTRRPRFEVGQQSGLGD